MHAYKLLDFEIVISARDKGLMAKELYYRKMSKIAQIMYW